MAAFVTEDVLNKSMEKFEEVLDKKMENFVTKEVFNKAMENFVTKEVFNKRFEALEQRIERLQTTVENAINTNLREILRLKYTCDMERAFNGGCCPICLETENPLKSIVFVTDCCKVHFHSTCLLECKRSSDEWDCPTCRASLVTKPLDVLSRLNSIDSVDSGTRVSIASSSPRRGSFRWWRWRSSSA